MMRVRGQAAVVSENTFREKKFDRKGFSVIPFHTTVIGYLQQNERLFLFFQNHHLRLKTLP